MRSNALGTGSRLRRLMRWCAAILVVPLLPLDIAQAQAPGNVCQPNADGSRAFITPVIKERSIPGSIQVESWFEFAPVPGVSRYTLTIVEYSPNPIPSVRGIVQSIDLANNPPTGAQPQQLHRTADGLIARQNTNSSAPVDSPFLGNIRAFYAGITGRAEIICIQEEVDLAVTGEAAMTRTDWDNSMLLAEYTAAVSNDGLRDAENVQLTFALPAGVMTSESISDSRCIESANSLSIVCNGLTIPAESSVSVTTTVRITNATDLDSIQTGLLENALGRGVRLVIANLGNDRNTADDRAIVSLEIPFREGTTEETRQAMDALSPHFDYENARLGTSCNNYKDEIFGRLNQIALESPDVFSNLSYGPISSGTYSAGGLDAGHVGVVVYLKGTNYRQTGIVINGTPWPSPLAIHSEIGRSGFSLGENSLNFTALSGSYLRTPISRYPGFPRAEVGDASGFEKPYEVGLLAPGSDLDDQTCPIPPDAVTITTASPVELIITSSSGRRIETRDGNIVAQELGVLTRSMAFRHDDGTYGWLIGLPVDDYLVQLRGTRTGAYTLTLTTFTAEGIPQSRVIRGTTVPDQLETFTLEAPEPPVVLPPPVSNLPPTAVTPPANTPPGNGASDVGGTGDFDVMTLALLCAVLALRSGAGLPFRLARRREDI